MAVVLTIIGLFFLCDLLWWHAADRLLRPLPRGRHWRLPLGLFMAAQALSILWFVAGRVLVRDADAIIPSWALTATFVWHLLVLPLAVVGWVLWATGRGVRALGNAALGESAGVGEAGEGGQALEPVQVPSPSRRQFLRATAAAAPPLVTVIGSAVATAQLDEFRVRRLTLDLPQLPRDLDGMTIAHVSDVHVGRFTHGRTLSRIVDATNELRSDLVLLTGDLINMNLSDLPAALDAVKRMEGKFGVYMAEGNHDLIENGREFRRVTKAAGVPLLVNEAASVRARGVDVQLLGLRWGSGVPGAGRSADRGDAAIAASLDELVRRAAPAGDAFPILLAHHPHAVDFAAKMHVPLTLSGHTHGGQLMLNERVGFGPWMYRYWSGAYRKGDAWGVVSNGVGNWFPLRTLAPAEIIHLTLRRG